MRKILISINPKHVENILSGMKKFEYRTRVAKKDIDSIIVYSTYPTKRVVAEVEIIGIISGTPDYVWSLTRDKSGITRNFFNKYFSERKIAYAYSLGKIKLYPIPLELNYFGVKTAPQSYIYL
ncbi:MAG: hypothetical protein RBQ97_08285 [Acholeplasma sp.]|nr:hypothetical protein [Acholeplasma sp.]